jgi:hypothetical protein
MIAKKSELPRSAGRVFPALVSVAGVTVALAAIPVESPQAGARMWVTSLSTADKMSYSQPDRLFSLPVEYRHALFSDLATPEERANFWHQVFREYRRTHPLTSEQRTFLDRIEAGVVRPASFLKSRTTEAQHKQIASATVAVAGTLGQEAVKELFSTAGPERGHTSKLPLMERIRHAWRVGRPQPLVALVNRIAAPVYAWSCNCVFNNECYSGTTCGGAACDQTSWGCAFLWTAPCTGLCGYYS